MPGHYNTQLIVCTLVNKLSKLWAWLRYPVALGIIAVLFWMNRAELSQVAATPKVWKYFYLGIALIAGSTLLTFVRWYLLVWGQQFPFRLRDAIRLGFIGLVCNYFSPGAVGGDLFKAVLLAHGQKSRRFAAVATIVLDRILGLLALFMVGVVASLMPIEIPDTSALKAATALLWVGTTAGLAGLGFMLLPATTRWGWVNRLGNMRYVGRILDELIHGVRLYQSKPGVLLAALAISLVGHMGLIGGFYCCALWMHQPWVPDLTTHFYFMPNAELFGTLLPVPGGIGALEGAVEWFYGQLAPASVPEAQAKAAGLIAALAFRVAILCINAVGGAYYFMARREVAQAMHEAQEEAPAVAAQ